MHFLINHDKKIIFGWSAKCACSTIKKIFYFLKNNKLDNKIGTIDDWKEQIPKNVHLYTTILFTRNPFKRLVSGFLDKYNKNGKDIIKSMVATADLSRSGFMNGDISTVMSPRTVLTWAENYIIFNDIEYAFKLSFLNRCDEIERPIIEEYFQRSFGIDISDAKVANVKE